MDTHDTKTFRLQAKVLTDASNDEKQYYYNNIREEESRKIYELIEQCIKNDVVEIDSRINKNPLPPYQQWTDEFWKQIWRVAPPEYDRFDTIEIDIKITPVRTQHIILTERDKDYLRFSELGFYSTKGLLKELWKRVRSKI